MQGIMYEAGKRDGRKEGYKEGVKEGVERGRTAEREAWEAEHGQGNCIAVCAQLQEVRIDVNVQTDPTTSVTTDMSTQTTSNPTIDADTQTATASTIDAANHTPQQAHCHAVVTTAGCHVTADDACTAPINIVNIIDNHHHYLIRGLHSLMVLCLDLCTM
jgi:hypothetical protein